MLQVDIEVNGQAVDSKMMLDESGHAFFVRVKQASLDSEQTKSVEEEEEEDVAATAVTRYPAAASEPVDIAVSWST